MPDNRIVELRNQIGLSQRAMAELLGTDASQVRRLEKSERNLTVHWMRRIATALKCCPSELLNDEDCEARLSEQEAVLVNDFRKLCDAKRQVIVTLAQIEASVLVSKMVPLDS